MAVKAGYLGGKMRGRVLGCGEAVKEGAIHYGRKTNGNWSQGRLVQLRHHVWSLRDRQEVDKHLTMEGTKHQISAGNQLQVIRAQVS